MASQASAAKSGSGRPTLLLLPTELELRRLEDQGGIPSGHAIVRVCGFGPVTAAARCAGMLEQLTPARVLLVGIAGAYDIDRDPLGSALEFSSVAIDGIGVGEGRELVPPPTLGFPQWPGSDSTPAIAERLPLAAPEEAGLLLTTCAASATPAQVEARLERFPEARAEDMEGFGVASACRLAGVPLRIVRGMSNRVGDRDAKHWSLPRALASARITALQLLESTWDEGGNPR